MTFCSSPLSSLFIASAVTLLSACGGGSSTSPNTVAIPTATLIPTATGVPTTVLTPTPAPSVAEDFAPTGETGELERPIIIDQFGYLPAMKKVAVIKDPQVGNDSRASYTPGSKLQVVTAGTTAFVYEGDVIVWKAGATDESSGDKAWHFDFSSVTTPGSYEILDPSTGKRSYEFDIDNDVYKSVLRDAVRTFFYQRAGIAKPAQYAGQWEDGASHLQDATARLYTAMDDPSTQRDVSGGWYDAGDYNKYTQWTARNIVYLLHAYIENKSLWDSAWGDDFNIPESGNEIADLLDEIKWGMDHLLRLQEDDGSVLSVVDLDHATPPSAATGVTKYGPANTSTTFMTAAAYAFGAKVWGSLGSSMGASYATQLEMAAKKAWDWGIANPTVVWQNNYSYATSATTEVNSYGIGAGRQECGISQKNPLNADYTIRAQCLDWIKTRKALAALYLYDATGDAAYKTSFEADYTIFKLFTDNYLSEFEAEETASLMYYADLADVTPAVKNNIRLAITSGLNGNNYAAPYRNKTDPYLSYLQAYTWGSNATKSMKGLTFMEPLIANRNLTTSLTSQELTSAAAAYIHYLHGVNPWGIAQLSNMDDRGADNSVDEFFHSWFDIEKDPAYNSNQGKGPAPGFIVGGANPDYSWQGCCWTQTCDVNATVSLQLCGGQSPPSPPMFQPVQKSFAEIGDGWPLNTWELTENSGTYQVQYIRLLSKFFN